MAVAPRWISDVIEIPDGPLILFDATGVPYRHLKEIPTILARELEAAGLGSGEIVAPATRGILIEMHEAPRGLVLCALPPNPSHEPWTGEVPRSWYDIAQKWLAENDLAGDVFVGVGVELRVDAPTLGQIVGGIKARRGDILMIRGTIPTRVVGAHVCREVVTIGLGGSLVSDEDFLAAFSRLQELGRVIARDASYAYISFAPTLAPLHGGIGSLYHFRPYYNEDMADVNHVRRIPETIVLKAFPWQMLGPEHLVRLGRIPENARPLEGGKVELQLGDPADWLPGASPEQRERNLKEGRRLLSACIVSSDEARDLIDALSGMSTPD